MSRFTTDNANVWNCRTCW